MATVLRRVGFVLAVLVFSWYGSPSALADTAVQADADASAVATFRTRLEPHGVWIEDPTYGLVWTPSVSVVGPDFKPYVTAGRWGLNENGDWIWVSDYPFGDVVFHYGRWVWIDGAGWAWVPGTQWAPAWVVWRVPHGTYSYVGWAPAPPHYVWVNGVFVSLWWSPPYPWVFCHSSYVFHHHVGHYVVHDRGFAHNVAQHTVRYRPGPSSAYPGPSMAQARVPATAVPRARTTAPARVLGSPATPHVASRPVPASQTSVGTNSSGLSASRRATTAAGPVPTSGAARPAAARPASSIAPTPARSVTARAPYDPRAGSARATSVGRPPVYAPSATTAVRPAARTTTAPPTYRAPSTPTYRSVPAPSYRAPSTPTYRSVPAPSYRAPSTPTYRSIPAPSYRTPASTGGSPVRAGGSSFSGPFRSGGASGGGFRGGGARGGRR